MAQTDAEESPFAGPFELNEWMPTLATVSIVLCLLALVFRGCDSRPAGQPQADPVQREPVQSHQREPVRTAIVWVADSYHCPSCVTLKDDLEWLKRNYKGWGGRWSYQIDNRGQVPRVEYFVNGQMVNSHLGYTTSNDWRKREPILKSIVARF